MLCTIIIGPQGLSVTIFDAGKWKMNIYTFDGDRLKSDLFLKLLGISLQVEKENHIEFDNFQIGKDTQEIIDFFIKTNLTKEEKLKTLVEQYLNEDTSREKFEQEIIPYRVAEKLSE